MTRKSVQNKILNTLKLKYNNNDDDDDDVSGQNKEFDLYKLLNNIGMNMYYKLFVENELNDIDILKCVSDKQLFEIGIKNIGQRIRILKSISKLNNNHHVKRFRMTKLELTLLILVILLIINNLYLTPR